MSATTGFTSKLRTAGNKLVPGVSSFDLAVADTEEAFALPTGTVFFSVQNMGKTVLRLAYAANDTVNGGNYLSIFPAAAREVDGIGAGAITIYLRAPAVQRVEIEYWS